MDGWIKVYRKLSDNPLWTCEPFTRGQAWIDLLMIANHEDGYFYIRNIKIDVKRGQVGWSILKLSERWRWSRTKTKKFLNDLEKEQQLIQHGDYVTQLLTIVNYNDYQKKEQQGIQQEDSSKTAGRQQEDINKNDKNDKNVKKVKEDADFLSKIIGAFQTSYFEIFGTEYVLMAKGKERAAASKILQLYKTKYPDANSETTIESLSAFFKNCCMIPDDWLQKNMSLPIIVSKFNEINNKLKNGTKKNQRVTPESIELIIKVADDAKGRYNQ